jgi:predicted Zn-dependent protease
MLHRVTVFFRVLIVLSVSLTAIGCATDKSVIAQAADSHKELDPATVKDPELAEYIQKVGDRVVKSARELVQDGYQKDRVFAEDPEWMFDEVKFHLVNSETMNAFTTGGQHVYLYSELFRSAKTEDEFAAVVSHEFAHIVARHVHKGMNRQYAILGTAAAAAVGGYALGGDNKTEIATAAGGLGLVAGQFIGLGFGRKDENEADKWGFQFYCHAGWDPDHFGDFFQQMVDKGYDTTPELASSHPLLRDRVENAKRRAVEWKEKNPNWKSQLKDDVVTPNQFRKLQERALAVGKSLPNDASLKAALLMFDSFPSCVAPKDQQRQIEARKELGELLEDAEKKK